MGRYRLRFTLLAITGTLRDVTSVCFLLISGSCLASSFSDTSPRRAGGGLGPVGIEPRYLTTRVVSSAGSKLPLNTKRHLAGSANEWVYLR